MSYIKKIFDRKNIKPVLIVFLVLTALILELVFRNLASGLSSQQLVERWQSDEKYAQLSVFFKEGYEPDGDMILQYRAMMYDALKDNAQGKTNILEALYYCGMTKSHKGSKEKEIIKINENS